MSPFLVFKNKLCVYLCILSACACPYTHTRAHARMCVCPHPTPYFKDDLPAAGSSQRPGPLFCPTEHSPLQTGSRWPLSVSWLPGAL